MSEMRVKAPSRTPFASISASAKLICPATIRMTHGIALVCLTMSDVKAKPQDKLAQASQRYESLRRELASLAPQMGFLLTGSSNAAGKTTAAATTTSPADTAPITTGPAR